MLTGAKNHRDIFSTPSNEETDFVARIFQVQHFQALIAQKSILTGRPVADPFVVAAAATKRRGHGGNSRNAQGECREDPERLPTLRRCVRKPGRVHGSSRLEFLAAVFVDQP
jgi:hypothetical protein